MKKKGSNSVQREYISKMVLISIFLGGFALFIGYMLFFGPGLSAFRLSWLDLTLLALATYRLGHLLSYDRVMEPIRQFFTVTMPDPTGAGDTVEPKGEGFQQAIGQWFCCPICTGTWVAALLVYTLYLFPDVTRVFLTMTAAIGAAEILNTVTESLSWNGQLARARAGAQAQARQKQVVTIETPCEDAVPNRDMEGRVITKIMEQRQESRRKR